LGVPHIKNEERKLDFYPHFYRGKGGFLNTGWVGVPTLSCFFRPSKKKSLLLGGVWRINASAGQLLGPFSRRGETFKA